MDIKPGEITDILKREIKDYGRQIDVAETGTVLSVGDGIARVYGLDKVMAGELVEFEGGLTGLVLNLEEDNVGIAVMGETTHVREGDPVRRTNRIIEVPAGESLVGRVVNALGQPIDGGPPPRAQHRMDVNGLPINPTAREYPKKFIQTGISAIDGMKLGAFDYLMKPCDIGELVAKVEQAAGRKQAQEEKIIQARIKEITSRRD